MPDPTQPNPAKKGWTENEKTRGAPEPGQSSGDAGEAVPKGKPHDDRAETESVAAELERDKSKRD